MDSKELETIKAAAERGDVNAQYQMGVHYYNAEGAERNYPEAVRWYRKAAENGHAQAQVNLAHCYECGKGLNTDLQQAFYWNKKAAEQGNAPAQFNVAIAYRKGVAVKQNLTQAVYWYRKAAEQGLKEAQYNLGNCFYKASYYKQAVSWYKLAAEQQCDRAEGALGFCYENGIGVEPDYEQAFYWYEKAASQGNSEAVAWISREVGQNNDVACLNIKDKGGPFPFQAYDIKVYSIDHNPPHIRLTSRLEGYVICISIADGELVSVKSYGNREKSSLFSDVVKMAKVWLERPSTVPGFSGKTNWEVASGIWETMHDMSACGK